MSRVLTLPGPQDTARTVLDNGLTLLVRENHTSPVVVLEGSLRSGGQYDPPELTGLSSFTANMLTRGSAQYDFATFNEIIEAVGASLSITSDTDSVNFGITCLSEDFAALVAVLADALRYPTFAPEQFKLVRRQKLVRLQERDQEPGAVANIRLLENLYGSHPFGKPSSGYVESVGRIQHAQVQDFHARHYTPRGAVIAISGNVNAAVAADLLHQTLGDWTAPGDIAGVASPPAAARASHTHIPMQDKVQSEIALGALAVARSHPDHAAIRVANTVLGVFGMMGRLGEVVREQQGLAYYAYSSQDASTASGVWTAGAGVNPRDLAQALASMQSEIARLRDEPVTAAELSDSQAYLTGVLPLTLETNDGIAATLLNMEWYGLGLDYLHRYNDLIRAITLEDVQRVAQQYLAADKMVVVSAGAA